MNLNALLGSYEVIKIQGDINIDITGISHDSREIKESNMFIAKKGYEVDGHNFIVDAIENGACCVVLEKEIEVKTGITYIWVKDTADILAYLSSRYYDEPSKKLSLIGVTGTNGKTSTTYFIKSILDVNNIKVGVIGTTGVIIDEKVISLKNTTPDPLVLNSHFDKMIESKVEACVMEVSSHALDFGRVDYINFDIGIFTNLTKDHLDYHITMKNYFESKLKLFYKTTNYNIINIDDCYGREIINNLSDRIKIITYGIENKADVYATNIDFSVDNVSFVLNYDEQLANISLKVPGKFNVYNALAAASCGIAMGLNLNEIKIGLENLKQIKGRFEIVQIDRDFSVIIDFAHTPDGLEAVLKNISQFAKGRVIVVFGAGGNRDKTKRPEMGEIVGLYSDYAIVTSDNPRFEDPLDIIQDIIEGLKRTSTNYKIIVDRKKAIEHALDYAKPNDIVLLAGKGHENYTIIGSDVYPFNEKEIVFNYLMDI
ncbi:UDP-N-acetylmuramoyl-L-alanyl-D-glutamate--2,6-diaminopimelate ligase [Tissierella sp. Yu-01]|uniref:UDP-N-acetylmuramoyl-L-alanyl-D-glutamate--2, 6-diaminopimelate ligase n=1 Tax=Tissierella sp. Yu-01 TaxID=3035694 RepID=UPI00240D6C65|nr:UDP-N-acetylmuramoyl-L-alanyl-D-glutamate--2,6-diaminopimelate ligase [Tissierella sp. Yu-01]WFA09628.1 UDP-N-acetylmuramoyl-L-alanyl-D-glutamate--2,6-diaminopimelate ligase [Tissierella sp. Yu-01]